MALSEEEECEVEQTKRSEDPSCMAVKMTELEKESHCWWFDSHNSAKRSPWLQLTLSELEKKTKDMLNLIEGDADSFSQRAEMYYRKRPELVNMMEDFYRSYRYLAEQHELLRSEAGARRIIFLKSDSSNRSSSQTTWDSTDSFNYPESEFSEVDNPEPEETDQVESKFVSPNKEFEGFTMSIEAKLSPAARRYKSKRISCSSMETNNQEHEDEIRLMEKENDQNTRSSSASSLRIHHSKQRGKYSHDECKEPKCGEADDHETKLLFENIVDNLVKLTSEVERLKMEKETLKAELERKDEEKRHVIRQLSLTVEILKEENVDLKKLMKDSKRPSSIFEFVNFRNAFSGTWKSFGRT